MPVCPQRLCSGSTLVKYQMNPSEDGQVLKSLRYFRDLSEEELNAALAADTPGAMTEESLRATLSRHPMIRRENTIPSWGERCAQSS